jgi:hypothetical protein
MGELSDIAKLEKLVREDYYENSDFFSIKYKKSDEYVTSIPISSITIGGFYFLHYKDDSNWMKYSPVFTAGVKKIQNIIILYAINLNFMPIELRVQLFDKFMTKETFEKNIPLKVDLKGVYNELLKFKMEYSLVEYVLNNVVSVHKINMNVVPRFLYSGHPVNRYDPKKLYSIQSAKSSDRTKRHEEISKLMMTDLIEIDEEISEKFDVLKNHIKRVQNNIKKL